MGTDQDSTGRVDFTRIGVELFGTGEMTPEGAEQRAAEFAPGYEVTRLLMTGAQAVTVEFDGGITARYSPKPPEPEPVAEPVRRDARLVQLEVALTDDAKERIGAPYSQQEDVPLASQPLGVEQLLSTEGVTEVTATMADGRHFTWTHVPDPEPVIIRGPEAMRDALVDAARTAASCPEGVLFIPNEMPDPGVAPVWSLSHAINRLEGSGEHWMTDRINDDLTEFFDARIVVAGGATGLTNVWRADLARVLAARFTNHLKELAL